MIQVFLFHIDLTLKVAMVTENGHENRHQSIDIFKNSIFQILSNVDI